MSMTHEERKYSIHMYGRNKAGLRKQLFKAARADDWDNVVYWAESIMMLEDKIKKLNAILKEKHKCED
jgi:hypothetical protein